MKQAIREKRISQFFRLSILLKGSHAILEIIGGVLLIFISPAQLNNYTNWIAHEKLLENPDNVITKYLLQAASELTTSHLSS